jgi:hypothetical protein
MIKKMVLLAAFALLVPALAVAWTVTYMTSGTFSGGNLPISFTGITDTVNADSSGVVGDLGIFTVGTCTTNPCKGPSTFTLTITQLAPTPGSNSISATITGTVIHITPHKLKIDFGLASISIGGITYTPLWPTGAVGLKFGTNTTVQLVVSTAEPTAELLLGLGAFGLMGLSLMSRKMITT